MSRNWFRLKHVSLHSLRNAYKGLLEGINSTDFVHLKGLALVIVTYRTYSLVYVHPTQPNGCEHGKQAR